MGEMGVPLTVWKNLNVLCARVGELFIFGLGNMSWGLFLSRPLAIASIAGVIRLARETRQYQFAFFSAGYIAMLVVWHYPPEERLILPVFPIFLAGLAREGVGFCHLLRVAWKSAERANRIVAAAAVMFLVLLGWLSARGVSTGYFDELPALIASERNLARHHRDAFRWISANLGASETMLAYYDPVLHLYTGQHGCRTILLPIDFYRDDREAFIRPALDLSAFASKHGLTYIVLTTSDFQQELTGEERDRIQQAARLDGKLQLIYANPTVSIYRVRNTTG
jgi:hypothetical protein